ncbi:hypothetical protein [Thalassomonas haliotis]|uniref:Uncharacterized protein n=1 Tax=Thalassomonas haliotis TaxID=485448 RepID=A0ABY7VIZ9_9GAMM|nr:hypothetical protein [Thalassomonas haliotis]WDE13724.1 hypothetical protein H3N35_09970 [Thalassomonas haliotis]
MNQSYALQAYCQINLSPIFNRFDELKKEFDRYKTLVDDNQISLEHQQGKTTLTGS